MTTTQMTKGNAELKGRGEGKTGPMEGKASQMEGKASQMEGKASQIEGKASQIEGKASQMIDKTAAAIPSGTFLVLAGGAIAGSLVLKLMGRDSTANFVGQWAPTILMLALYNKMVKMLGSQEQAGMQGRSGERSGAQYERSGSMQERSGASSGASSGPSSGTSSGASSGPSSGASNDQPGGSQVQPGFPR